MWESRAFPLKWNTVYFEWRAVESIVCPVVMIYAALTRAKGGKKESIAFHRNKYPAKLNSWHFYSPTSYNPCCFPQQIWRRINLYSKWNSLCPKISGMVRLGKIAVCVWCSLCQLQKKYPMACSDLRVFFHFQFRTFTPLLRSLNGCQ